MCAWSNELTAIKRENRGMGVFEVSDLYHSYHDGRHLFTDAIFSKFKTQQLTMTTKKHTGKLPKDLEVPKTVCIEAQDYYNTIVRILLGSKVIAEVDYPTVPMLAYHYHTYYTATQDVLKNGTIYDSTTGNGDLKRIANPSVKTAQEAAVRLEKLLAEYGLTPKARGVFKEKDTVGDVETPLTALAAAIGKKRENR